MRPLRWLAWLLAAVLLLPPDWRGEPASAHSRPHAATDSASTAAVARRPNGVR